MLTLYLFLVTTAQNSEHNKAVANKLVKEAKSHLTNAFFSSINSQGNINITIIVLR